MSIIKEIRSAIIAQMFAAEKENDKRQHVCRVLVDLDTYSSIRSDAHFRDWCDICYPVLPDDTNIVITIMGKAIVPTYEVKGFELMLINGTVIKPAAKDTAQD